MFSTVNICRLHCISANASIRVDRVFVTLRPLTSAGDPFGARRLVRDGRHRARHNVGGVVHSKDLYVVASCQSVGKPSLDRAMSIGGGGEDRT